MIESLNVKALLVWLFVKYYIYMGVSGPSLLRLYNKMALTERLELVLQSSVGPQTCFNQLLLLQ